MGQKTYVLLRSKMTSFPPSEGVREITFGSILDLYGQLHQLNYTSFDFDFEFKD